MFTAYVVVTLLAIAAYTFSGVAALVHFKPILPGMVRAGVPQSWLTFPIGTLKTAGAVGLLLGLLLGAVGSAPLGVLLTPGLAGMGFFAPDAFLNVQIKRRREQVRAELPDALDLLSVSVEAGLGFDGAVTKLTEHMEGPLVSELAITLSEIRIGESRQDALKKMADRVPAPELAAFVRAVIQADQLGISMGRILRVQAADSRLRRQAAAEERAMKAPIKMLFPTAIFIFPAMFLVILGPALITVLKAFK
jgi:tight adherence protein C